MMKNKSPLLLNIYLQPKASRDEIIGLHGDDEIKITITAPPIDGEANRYLIKLLAKQFGVAKKQVTIVKGEQSRHKKVSILDPKIIPDIFANFLSKNKKAD